MRTIHGVAVFRKTACTTSPFVAFVAIVNPAPPGICSISWAFQVKPKLFKGTFERRCVGLQAELKLWGTIGGHGCRWKETVDAGPCPGCDCTSSPPMKLICLFPYSELEGKRPPRLCKVYCHCYLAAIVVWKPF